ncbi:MAG: STAS domain-containing protein [Bacteroidales bacterium]|jgi:anti-anti-sigma factor|nr:STAS domain-containing protein [Bacteroidales bacterium]MDD4604459.1 STAS domain-containing protein [Bacteroidales bacterium]
MELSEQKTPQCTIVGIIGRLDTTNYSLLEKKLMDLIDNQQTHILVECSKMDYVSSSGLRILLMALKKITLAKGKFVLCGLQENIREIFEISGFTNIFEICGSKEDALLVF